jgi:hypothetical protein
LSKARYFLRAKISVAPNEQQNGRLASATEKYSDGDNMVTVGPKWPQMPDDPVDDEFYIGSADWMYPNLSKRVELVTPILDADCKARRWEILDICLLIGADTRAYANC